MRGTFELPASPNAARLRFEHAVLRNPHIGAVLDALARSDLPGGCLTGGCVFQTVWNAAHGFEPTHGILDYDVFYFDAADVSSAAERQAGERLAALCGEIPVRVEVSNQARVPLWYEQTFGAPCGSFERSEDGIDAFLVTSGFGLRRTDEGLSVYAPYGFSDVLDRVVRPNPARVADAGGLGRFYGDKVARWSRVWPQISVVPWPAPTAHRGDA
jgi:hypothetical protein